MNLNFCIIFLFVIVFSITYFSLLNDLNKEGFSIRQQYRNLRMGRETFIKNATGQLNRAYRKLFGQR